MSARKCIQTLSAIQHPQTLIDVLYDDVMQAVFQFFDHKSLLFFSRCSKTCLKRSSCKKLWDRHAISVGRILNCIKLNFYLYHTSFIRLPQRGMFVLNRSRRMFDALVPILEKRNTIVAELNRLHAAINDYTVTMPVLLDFLALDRSRHQRTALNLEIEFRFNKKQQWECKKQIYMCNAQMKSVLVDDDEEDDVMHDYDYVGISADDMRYMGCVWCRLLWCRNGACAEKLFEIRDVTTKRNSLADVEQTLGDLVPRTTRTRHGGRDMDVRLLTR